MATYQQQVLMTTQAETLGWQPLDSAGNPVSLDGAPTFTVVPTGVCTVTFTAGGGAIIIAQGVGTATVTAAATSSGVPLSESFTVQVNPDAAITFGFKFGTPGPKS